MYVLCACSAKGMHMHGIYAGTLACEAAAPKGECRLAHMANTWEEQDGRMRQTVVQAKRLVLECCLLRGWIDV